MNDLQNSILESISILANSASQSTPTTLTVEAVVLNAVDAGSGLYLVEYLGNKFQAYSDVTSKYSPGELVYVLIPNGDFTKNKIILRAVAPSAKNYIEDTSKNFYYNNVSNNLLDFGGTISLSSYNNEEVNLTEYIPNVMTILNEYYKDGVKTFKLSTSVKTNILGQSYGNYGLKLRIPIKSGGLREYVLDTGDILGNPYTLNTWTPQSKVFTIEDLDSSRSVELYAFVDGFIEDEILKEKYDIFFQGLNLFGVELITGSTEVTSYRLALSASDGSLFLTEDNNKTIIPQLFINGAETSLEGFDCYWFMEDATVSISSKEYLAEGGVGWRCVNKKSSVSTTSLGSLDIQYILSDYFYTVLFSSIEDKVSCRYKCVINYDGILISKIIELRNYVTQPFEISLSTSSGSTTFIQGSDIKLTCELKKIPVDLAQEIVYIWHLYDKQGNFIDKNFINYTKQSLGFVEVEFSSNLIDELGIVRVFICKLDTDTRVLKTIGSAAINLAIAIDGEYFISITPNNILYKYDSDGDSPLIADYDGPNPISAIEPLRVHIYKKDGTELTDSEYQMANIQWILEEDSLFKPLNKADEVSGNLQYFYSQDFPYSIASTFNKNDNEKKLLVTVDVNGTYLEAEPNIQFFKEGVSGLNGSKYTALIFYGKDKYNPYTVDFGHNLVAIKYINTSSTEPGVYWKTYNKNGSIIDFNSAQPLELKVYKDGKIIEIAKNNISWDIFENVGNNNFSVVDGKVNVETKTNGVDHCIIQATVIIPGDSDTSTLEVLYCYYPIDIIEYQADSLYPNKALLPLITGGFFAVEYTKDGINPTYDTTKNFELACQYEKSDESNRFYGYNWRSSDEQMLFLNNKSNASRQEVSPTNRYDSVVNNLFISLDVTPKELKSEDMHAKPDETLVDSKIVQLENNRTYTELLLNRINEIYSIWQSNLNICTDLLAYRESILLELDKLDIILDNILMIRENSEQAKTLKEQINNMRTQVYDFQTNSNNPDYSLYFLNLEYIDSIADTAVTKMLGSDFNREIIFYNSACENLIKYATTEFYSNAIKAYKTIKNVSIKDIKDIDYADLRKEYQIIANKFQEVIDGIKYQTSMIALHDYLEYVITILSNYSVWDGNKYILSNSLSNWFDNEINNIDAEYNQQLALYNCDIKQNATKNIPITVKRPVMFLYSRDGLSTVQGWDGNKIYVEDNTEYLTSLHAAVGPLQTQTFSLRGAAAGFNGVALGTHVKVNNDSEERDQGIYGYYNGKQTFMLNATNGVASFGVKGQGQIILDPSQETGIIRSGNYSTTNSYTDENNITYPGQGMQIDLTTPEIRYGSGYFIVDKNGRLNAKEAIIDGTIYAKDGVFEGKVIAGEGSSFAGEITATSGTFTGAITATSGQFGNLLIDGDRIVIVTEYDAEGKPITSKEFIDANGNTIVDFAEQGKVLTSLTSNIGGWTVVGTESAQMLQGVKAVGGLILNPITNKIYYENVNTISNTSATDLYGGFYLGNDGFVVPNVFQVQPTDKTGYWNVNSRTVQWNDLEGQINLKFGADEINLFNKIFITNEDIKFCFDEIALEDTGIKIITDGTFVLNSNQFTINCLDNNSFTCKNFLVASNNVNFTNEGFNLKVNNSNLLEGQIANGVTSLIAQADNVSLGKNKDIIITTNTITFKEKDTIKIGKSATFTDIISKIHNNDETSKVEVNGDNVSIVSKGQTSLGDEIIIADNNIQIKAENITLSDAVSVKNNEVIIGTVKIDSNTVENTGNFKNIGNTTIEGAVSVTGNTTINGPMSVTDRITVAALTVGTVEFSNDEMIKLKQILTSFQG